MNKTHTGILKAWNEARGFGFVRPDDGSDDVFLHVRALPPGSPTPQVGQRVRYERTLSADLKPRAAGARLLPADPRPAPERKALTAPSRAPSRAQPATARHRSAPAPTSAAAPARRPATRARRGDFTTAQLAWLVAFAVLYAVCSAIWGVPGWVAGVYAALSLLTYGVYAADKRAAQDGAWRVPEKHLLLLGLAGGWPGALVAQQRLRHKSSKAEFRAMFWLTVVLNVAGFVALVGPWGLSRLIA